MSRDHRLRLEDILAACDQITAYIDGMDKAAFAADRRTVDAVLRNLEIMGEAVKTLPPRVRARQPDVDWKRIAGFRDVLIHAYYRVDLDIVWDILTTRLPALRRAVTEMLADETPTS